MSARRPRARGRRRRPAPVPATGYRTDDPQRQAKSPFFHAGQLDALMDQRRMAADPPQPVRGLDPQKEWSYMYRAGYESIMAGTG